LIGGVCGGGSSSGSGGGRRRRRDEGVIAIEGGTGMVVGATEGSCNTTTMTTTMA